MKGKERKGRAKRASRMVEAAGIEPATAADSERAKVGRETSTTGAQRREVHADVEVVLVLILDA